MFTDCFKVDEEIWTSVRRQVVRVAIEYLGWGCWDFIRHQLRQKVTLDDIHVYLHAVTKLASFRGLKGKHLDVNDLASYFTRQLDDVNKLLVSSPMHSYLPPQIYCLGSYSAAAIDAGLAKFYCDRFGLHHDEVDLAETFFTKKVPKQDPQHLRAARLTEELVQPKNMLHFTDYHYENYHRGVYPLDTNCEGVLMKFAGGYEID